jgi:hypothetical protein
LASGCPIRFKKKMRRCQRWSIVLATTYHGNLICHTFWGFFFSFRWCHNGIIGRWSGVIIWWWRHGAPPIHQSACWLQRRVLFAAMLLMIVLGLLRQGEDVNTSCRFLLLWWWRGLLTSSTLTSSGRCRVAGASSRLTAIAPSQADALPAVGRAGAAALVLVI